MLHLVPIHDAAQMTIHHIKIGQCADTCSAAAVMLVCVRKDKHIKIFRRKGKLADRSIYRQQLFFYIPILPGQFRIHLVKQGNVHFKIINGRLFVFIMVPFSERNDFVAPAPKNFPHPFPLRGVKQNVVVRHFPHSGLWIPVLQDAAFQGHMPNSRRFQLLHNGCPLGIQQHILSDCLVFGFPPMLLYRLIGTCKNCCFLQCHAHHCGNRMIPGRDIKLLQIHIGQKFFLRRNILERTRHQIKHLLACFGCCTHFAAPQYSSQWL